MIRSTLLCLFSIAVASAQTAPNVYVQHNLISSVPGMADVTDPNLIAPWGVSYSATSPFWVSNAGKGNTTVYNDASTAGITVTTTVVTIPAGGGKTTASEPTGQVQNSTGGFLLANGKAASFIFCTADGTISAWNGGTTSTVMVDFSSVGTAYYGMAIGTGSGAPLLYAANFSFGKIDVFDTNFKLTSVPGGFGDPNLPPGYAPFNIWPVNGKLFVAYGLQNASKTFPVAAVGNGVVDIFDFNGNLQQRLTAGGPLNSPWGVAQVGGGWGALSNSILVGNFGDGHINAFNPTTGALIGTMEDATGAAITLPGLWALVIGNGASGGDNNFLYFTAAITNNGAQAGLFGSLAPPAQITGVHNAASGPAPAIAPGEIVALTGISVGPRPAVTSTSESSAANAGTSLGGTTVTVNGTPAPILYTQADQTNIIIPFGVTGTTASIVVTTVSGTTTTTTQTMQVPLAPTAPGMFYGGNALAYNQDGTLNSATNPAPAGSVVVIYCTGLGQTDPPGQDGVRYGSLVLAEAVLPVTATIGGQAATVIYAGSAPGQIAGLMQVELVIPTGAGTGGIPVVLTTGGVSSASAGVFLK
jgi:uncharacterized protein (TIGR03118 family)